MKTKLNLSLRQIEILKIIFYASSHFEKMALTKEEERTFYQKELSELYDTLEKITN